MSLKWTDNTGILRKNEPFDDNKEELLVFGYSCKLFRDDEKAQHIDQGKHLIPWMGDETNKIDRYDARGTLYELHSLEPPQGGYDWRHILNDAEKRIEQLCDEERYRALFCDEDEEEMYKEEELKRLHASSRAVANSKSTSYGEVAFNYDVEAKVSKPDHTVSSAESGQEDEPFMPPKEIDLSDNIVVPLSNKHHTIIVKTASFIASHGVQMEILLKTKQAGNPQFDFLSMDCPLYAYYRRILEALKNGTYKPNVEEVEEKEKSSIIETYLHPSLTAPEPLESAPFIPNINYKPSADCAYSILVSKITGTKPVLPSEDESDKQVEQFADGELAPPGTQPLTLPKDLRNDETAVEYTQEQLAQYYAYYGYHHLATGQIEKGPVLYGRSEIAQQQQSVEEQSQLKPPGVDDDEIISQKKKSLGLNLIAYSDSEGEGDSDDNEDGTTAILMPPSEVQLVIDKMAAYVVKNGTDFEKVVIAKNDPRFNFLNSTHQYHAYYKSKLKTDKPHTEPKAPAVKSDSEEEKIIAETEEDSEKTQEVERKTVDKDDDAGKICNRTNEKNPEKKVKKIAPVSFSIKKLKEPDAILTNTALPYESSTDEEQENNENDSKSTTADDPKETVKIDQLKSTVKMDHSKAAVKVDSSKPAVKHDLSRSTLKADHAKSTNTADKLTTVVTSQKTLPDDRNKSKPENIKTSDSKEEAKKSSVDEVITIDEDMEPTELIDLTVDTPDDRLPGNGVVDDKLKQLDRKRRATAFLAAMKVKGGPEEQAAASATGSIPAIERNTLASVMVKTLMDLQAKKEQEESTKHEKRRKRRHRDCSEIHSEGSDHGQIFPDKNDKYKKKSKRKKYSRTETRSHKKSSKHKKQRRHRESSGRKKTKRPPKSSSRKTEKCLELLKKLDNVKVINSTTPPRELLPKDPRSVARVINEFNLGPDYSDKSNGSKDKTEEASDGEIENSDEESGEITSSSSSSSSQSQ